MVVYLLVVVSVITAFESVNLKGAKLPKNMFCPTGRRNDSYNFTNMFYSPIRSDHNKIK